MLMYVVLGVSLGTNVILYLYCLYLIGFKKEVERRMKNE